MLTESERKRRRAKALLGVVMAETDARAGGVFRVCPGGPSLLTASGDFDQVGMDIALAVWERYEAALRNGKPYKQGQVRVVPLLDGPNLCGLLVLDGATPDNDTLGSQEVRGFVRQLAERVGSGGEPRGPTAVASESLESQIRATLIRFSGNVARTARQLSIPRRTLYMRFEQFGIDPSDYR